MSQSVGKINSEVFEFKWRVKVDDDEVANKTNGQAVASPQYVSQTFGKEIKWRLRFYPKGFRKEDENHLSVYLSNESTFQVEATVTLFMVKKDGEKVEGQLEKHLFKVPDQSSWGNPKFMEKTFAENPENNIMVENEITIGCRVTINGIQNQDQKSFSRINLLDDFEKLLLNKNFNDLAVISADEKKLHVHKGILVCRSPVFEAMFEHDTVEREESVVSIQDFNYDVLLEMFRFIYSGKVNEIEPMVCDLLRAAEKYSIQDLKLMCEETMMVNLTKTNAIKYLIAADLNNSYTIKMIREFIIKNPKDYVNTQEFKSLMISHVDLTYEIINSVVYGENN